MTGDEFKGRVDVAQERAAEARANAGERLTEARSAAGERIADAKANAGERVTEAKAATAERVETAKAATADAIEKVKPRLRGVSHQWAFFVALVAGAILVWAAPDGRATLAAAIYAGSLAALLGTSALYHRVNWRRPRARAWMRRIDHSMIFMLIAGTVTPFALLVMQPPFATALLIAVWAGAGAGIIVELIWIDAPKWVTAIVYLAVGWIGALGFPAILIEAGIGAAALIAVGGVMYTVGAVVYARQRPGPRPAVFGYHEIFHVLVIAAAITHFAAIAIYAVPAG
ncbi:MAG: PAQR family membrane homeostasis protein TrhA [Solirubrobacterales bacterium]